MVQKFATWNVNGVRAAMKGGLLDFLESEKPDVLCLQEVKAAAELTAAFAFEGYRAYWHCAEKAGYSGTAFLIGPRVEVVEVRCGMGVPEIDREGRVMVLETPNYILVNVYAPHSQRELGRLGFKLDFSKAFDKFMKTLQATGKPVMVTGDLNVAHHDVDLANPKANRKNAGFLPEERVWLDGWAAAGWFDGFRHFTKENGHYTWWSQRVGVREKNVGWRIDAFWLEERLKEKLVGCSHRPQQRGSDHCPVVLELAV